MRYKQKSKMEGKNHINNSIKYEWNKHSNQKRDCQIRLKKSKFYQYAVCQRPL